MSTDPSFFADQARSYFSAFTRGDLDGLREMFHPEIDLRDWTGHWRGMEAVLKTNAAILENKPVVEVLNLDTLTLDSGSAARTYCKIQVFIGGKTLKVLDVLDWSHEGKILSIEAFLG